MDNHQPVTRAELHQELAVFRQDLRQELMEDIRQIETNLLTAFHGFVKSNNSRLHDLENGEHDLRERVASLEDRVLALETRRPQ